MTLIFTFLFITGFILLMAVGVIMGRKPIRGSCGGQAQGSCALCGGDKTQCTSDK